VNDRHTVWLRCQTGYISQSSDLLNNFNVFDNKFLLLSLRLNGLKKPLRQHAQWLGWFPLLREADYFQNQNKFWIPLPG
jgi:ABC-type proline/glycine betaine transport system ATPase subunit